MTIQAIFNRLGLPAHSGTIYTELSRRGSCSPTTLAKATAVHRPALYRALRSLLQEKFIKSETIGKRTTYYALDAQRIKERFAGEVKKVDQLAQSFSHGRSVNKVKLPGGTTVSFLSGHQAITDVFMDVAQRLQKGEVFYRYTSEQDLGFVNKYLPPAYRNLRDKKKLERLVISNPRSAGQKRSRLERFIRTIPEGDEVFTQNIIQLVYGSRVAIIDLSLLEALVIEHKMLANFQATIFRTLYRRLDAR